MIEFLRKLAGFKSVEITPFSKILGRDDMLFWADVANHVEQIEYLKLLKNQKGICPEGEDFTLWILEGCRREALVLEEKKEAKKYLNKKLLKESEYRDKLEAEVKSLL